MAARYSHDVADGAGPGGAHPAGGRHDAGAHDQAKWGISAQPLSLAVTGVACRLPGAADVEAFWSLLAEGRCAITAVPEDRWSAAKYDRPAMPDGRRGGSAAAGRSYTRAAGILDDLWAFDAGFFGISAREAAQMDPQQRLLLELTWEAMEDAAFVGGGYRRDPADRSGPGRTGVYVGAATMDHAQRFAADAGGIDSPFMTGNTLSVIANRVSHVFDFRGPSLVVDTACASSMTALHLAAAALERGEIDTAIVAGVNALLQPFNFVGFSAAAMLSPTGRCRPFADGADGYVRGEGAVVLVLRRRETALAAGEPVRAVLCASGIGTDGHKAGLTRPSPDAQAALIAAVHKAAGLAPDQLAFVEAHGTGTPTGDPVEATGIARALGAGRGTAGLGPLPIGSVKGNIGHLEPAAGLAGVLKAILALGHGRLPASLGVATVQTEIARLDAVKIADDAIPLTDRHGPAAAGVSAFGFGGANAHTVLRAPTPEENVRNAIERGQATSTAALPPLVLSAHGEAALGALARRWRGVVEVAEKTGNTSRLARAIESAETRRSRLQQRAVIAAARPRVLARALDALADCRGDSAVTRCTALPEGRRRIALLFAGNGAQWAGMGEALLADDPVARAAFSRAADAITDAGGPDVEALMRADDLAGRLEDSVAAQTLLFAQQVAAAEAVVTRLAERDLAPALVAGHSVGEVAAAWAAGCLTLKDAARLIVRRAEAVRPLRGRGAMAAVLSDAAGAEALIAEADLADRLSLAAENSPRSVTVSGEAAALEDLARVARQRRVALRRLAVPYPYHSAALDAVESALRTAFAGLTTRPGQRTLVSSVTGGPVDGGALDPDHWWANARAPVRFRAAAEAAAGAGCGLFVEIGPRPVLAGYVRDCLGARGEDALCLAMDEGPGRAPMAPRAPMIAAVAACAGAETTAPRGDDRDGASSAPGRRRMPGCPGLPRYPWQHRRHRAAPSATAIDLFGLAPATDGQAVSPLLGHRDRAESGPWYGMADAAMTPWLADHVIGDRVLMPATAFAMLALKACSSTLATGHGETAAVELVDLDILSACVLTEGARRLRITVEETAGTVIIDSAAQDGTAWQRHARSHFRAAPSATEGAPLTFRECDPRVSSRELYDLLRSSGFRYGPQLRRLYDVQHDGTTARGRIRAASRGETLADDAHFSLHPAQFDAALHLLHPLLAPSGATDATATPDTVLLPTRIARLRLCRAVDPGEDIVAQARILRRGAESAVAALELHGEDGSLIAAVDGIVLERVARPDVSDTTAAVRGEPARAAETWHTHWLALPALSPEVVQADRPGGAGRRVQSLVTALHRRLGGPCAEEPGAILLDEACRAALGERESRRDGQPRASVTEADVAPAQDCEALSTVVPALLAHDPTRGLELLAALSLPEATPHGAAQTLMSRGPRRDALQDGCLRAAAVLASHTAHAARVLAIGLDDDAIERLCHVPGIARVLVADRPRRHGLNSIGSDGADRRHKTGAVGRPRALATPDGDPADAEEVDLVLVAGATMTLSPEERQTLLHRLGPNGVLVAAEADPSLDVLAASVSAPEPEVNWREAGAATGSLSLPDRHLAARLVVAMARTGISAADGAVPDRRPVVLLADPGAMPTADMRGGQGRGGIGDAIGRLSPQATRHTLDRPGRLAGSVVVVAPPSRDDLEEGEGDAALGRRIALCRAIARRTGDNKPAAVYFLTHRALGAQISKAGSDGLVRPVEAGIAALRRVMANEQPAIRWRLIDGVPEAPEAAPPAPVAAALGTLLDLAARAPDGRKNPALREGEIVLDRDGGAWAPRHYQQRWTPSASSSGTPGAPMMLKTARRGGLHRLAWHSSTIDDARAPGPGEVRVAVDAAALNFRDLMAALGRLPPRMLEGGFTGACLGMEMAGRVVAVGEGVAMAPGAPVLGFAAGALASSVVTDARLVVPRPDALPAADAAALPAAYLTAVYALNRLARVTPGERVLIHNATGGLGLAAMSVALRHGARVFATAGRPGKRRLAEALGAEAVFDSRDPGFADAVMEATAGEGVDVVLNALAGDAQRRGLECLAPFGRFVELGKHDIALNHALPLGLFAENLSFLALDADRLLAKRPADVGRLLQTLVQDVAAGALPRLPITVFAAGEIREAMALMQRADHVGKIVVRPPVPSAPAPPTDARRRADHVRGGQRPAWIVAGGTGGLGFATAVAIARERGARVWLVSRRPPSPARARRIAALAREGVTLLAHRADAADIDAMRALVERIRSEGYALEGVVHAAMALRDGPVERQNPTRIATVLHAKTAVARALHDATADIEDAVLVMLGSAASWLGNPHQAAYAAANGVLEGLARARRAAGQRAMTIVLGPVGDAGRLAEDAALRQRVQARLERHAGGRLLTVAEVTSAVLAAIADPDAAAVIPLFGAGTGTAAQRTGAPALPLLAEPSHGLIAATAPARPARRQGAASEGAAPELPIDCLDPAERPGAILTRLRTAAAGVLRQAAEEIDTDRPLAEIGFDSLMAVDLKLAAEEALCRALPFDGLGDGVSLRSLAEALAPAFGAAVPATVGGGSGDDRPDRVAGSSGHDDRIADRAMVDGLMARHAAKLDPEAREGIAASLTRDRGSEPAPSGQERHDA